MKRLFIIGNGFDLAHKLPTLYIDFKNYLVREYDIDENKYFYAPEFSFDPDGGMAYDDDYVAGFVVFTISQVEGDKWSDLENTLGVLDYSDALDDYFAEEDPENPYEDVYRMEDRASGIVIPMKRITNYFEDWIETIEINDDIQQLDSFKKLIDSETGFLSFNYTDTLEEVYHVSNVCHIHGYQGGTIHFGHGNLEDNYDYYQSSHMGAEDHLLDIHLALRKNIKVALDDSYDFFETITDELTEIYSFGFSFGDVDLVYMKEIMSRCDSRNITWYLNGYDPKTRRDHFEKLIKSCGFKGKFSIF